MVVITAGSMMVCRLLMTSDRLPLVPAVITMLPSVQFLGPLNVNGAPPRLPVMIVFGTITQPDKASAMKMPLMRLRVFFINGCSPAWRGDWEKRETSPGR